MSEPRFDNIVRELRATAPPAPDRLRDRVRALPQPSPRRAFRLRPALAAAAAIAVAVGIGAALIGGATRSSSPKERALTMVRGPSPNTGQSGPAPTQGAIPWSATPLPPAARLQGYRASLRLRVTDLSAATKSAIRTTRRLGGYVAAADYSTGANAGDSSLDLRVPINRVQQAIASFTELGTILSQRIAVSDLQAGLDQVDNQIAAERKLISELERKAVLTPTETSQLELAKRTLARLSRGRASLVLEETYAKISLVLTSRKPAAKQMQPGRFERFWGDAGDILGKEAIIVLYAIVVAGPFLPLSALALLGERARRRRADTRLLEETG